MTDGGDHARARDEGVRGRSRRRRRVNLTIEDGEFMVLVGPSGCGKSTLLRMIAGLEEITDGRISIGDARRHELRRRERDIAMVFQNYALYPHMTVRENLGFGLSVRRTPKAEIDAGSTTWRRCSGSTTARPQAGAALRRPAAARRDRARDGPRPGCSCSTSRSRTSTPSCASRCALEISGCTQRLAVTTRLRDPRPDRGDDARPTRSR